MWQMIAGPGYLCRVPPGFSGTTEHWAVKLFSAYSGGCKAMRWLNVSMSRAQVLAVD